LIASQTPFDLTSELRDRVAREINELLAQELERMSREFSYQPVRLTERERSSRIKASEFLQL